MSRASTGIQEYASDRSGILDREQDRPAPATDADPTAPARIDAEIDAAGVEIDTASAEVDTASAEVDTASAEIDAASVEVDTAREGIVPARSVGR